MVYEVISPRGRGTGTIIGVHTESAQCIDSLDMQKAMVAGGSKDEMLTGHRDTLYIFGHIPHKEITRMDRPNSGCTYLDIDTSPYGVSVIKLSNYL